VVRVMMAVMMMVMSGLAKLGDAPADRRVAAKTHSAVRDWLRFEPPVFLMSA